MSTDMKLRSDSNLMRGKLSKCKQAAHEAKRTQENRSANKHKHDSAVCRNACPRNSILMEEQVRSDKQHEIVFRQTAQAHYPLHRHPEHHHHHRHHQHHHHSHKEIEPKPCFTNLVAHLKADNKTNTGKLPTRLPSSSNVREPATVRLITINIPAITQLQNATIWHQYYAKLYCILREKSQPNPLGFNVDPNAGHTDGSDSPTKAEKHSRNRKSRAELPCDKGENGNVASFGGSLKNKRLSPSKMQCKADANLHFHMSDLAVSLDRQPSLPVFEMLPPLCGSSSSCKLLYQHSYLLNGIKYDYGPDSKYYRNSFDKRLPLDCKGFRRKGKKSVAKPSDNEIIFGNARIIYLKQSGWEPSRIQWLLDLEQKYREQDRQRNKLKNKNARKCRVSCKLKQQQWEV